MLLSWVQLPSLFVLFSIVNFLGLVLIDGLAFGTSLQRLPSVLEWWVPAMVGIAAATLPTTRESLRTVVVLAVLGVSALGGLDVLGAVLQRHLPVTEWAVTASGDSILAATGWTIRPESWISTVTHWLSGGLPRAAETLSRYPAGHARILVAQALAESSGLFLILGTLGAILGINRWIHENVDFKKPGNEIVAEVTLGWIVAPTLTVLATSFTSKALTSAMFYGGALAGILAPNVVIAVLGIGGLLYALRVSR